MKKNSPHCNYQHTLYTLYPHTNHKQFNNSLLKNSVHLLSYVVCITFFVLTILSPSMYKSHRQNHSHLPSKWSVNTQKILEMIWI